MQDSVAKTAASMQVAKTPPFPEAQEQNLQCPRCHSTNTKFCYYNNYNLSQPRHFCKNCRRYWTKGGALRNIPVGGGTRKTSKRSSSSSSSSSISKRSIPPKPPSQVAEPPKTEAAVSVLCSSSQPPPKVDSDRHVLNMAGSFSSLLACDGHLEAFLGSLPPIAPIGAALFPSSSGVEEMELQTFAGNGGADALERSEGESGWWAAGWTDLAIYHSGSTLH